MKKTKMLLKRKEVGANHFPFFVVMYLTCALKRKNGFECAGSAGFRALKRKNRFECAVLASFYALKRKNNFECAVLARFRALKCKNGFECAGRLVHFTKHRLFHPKLHN